MNSAVEKEVAALEHSREGMEEAGAVRVGAAGVGVAKAAMAEAARCCRAR